MRKDEFENDYCKRSGWTVEKFRQRYVTLPCNCAEDHCEGWAKISLDEDALLHHLAFNLPDNARLQELAGEALRAVSSAGAATPAR
jgi:hypothetical protein